MAQHKTTHPLLAAAFCGAALLTTAASSAAIDDAPASDADLKARAETIFAELVERYRGFSTYSDTASVEFDVEADEDNLFGGMMPNQETALAYAAPNKLAIEGEHMKIISDGEKVWVHFDMFGQYMERDAGETWADALLGDESQMLLQSIYHPIIMYLIHGDERAADYQPELVEVLAIEIADRGGKRGTLIRGTAQSQQYRMMYDEPIPFEVWIDEQTGLLGESISDLTGFYNNLAEQMADFAFDDDEDDEDGTDEMAMPTYERFRMVVKIKDARVNEDIPAERFAFEPDDDMRKVDEFEFGGSSRSSQLVLIGETAPDFTLPTLDGEELTLSSLRGNVVLLDFWALWCGPCVQALPHIQKIADRFTDQRVVVLGVNRDPDGSEDRIERMLERREVTFGPHVLDVDGEAAEMYHVQGIPCTVLIDKNGIVQDIGVGFHPGKVEDLSNKIEKLLAGEQLHTPEEIAELRARAEEADEDGPVAFFGGDRKAQREVEEALIEAIGEAPGSLNALALPRSMRQNSWHIKLIDIKGDGVKKAVVPQQRALHIIDLHERSSERIALSGIGSGSIQSFGIARINGEVHWLVSTARHGMFGSVGGTFGMFGADGDAVWTFSPELPRDMMVSFGEPVAADLTGDGTPEIIVTLHAVRMQRGGRRSMPMPEGQASQIIVLTAAGEVLARHAVGGYVYGLHVIDPAAGEEKPRQSIICVSDGRAMWLEYSDAAEAVSLRQ